MEERVWWRWLVVETQLSYASGKPLDGLTDGCELRWLLYDIFANVNRFFLLTVKFSQLFLAHEFFDFF